MTDAVRAANSRYYASPKGKAARARANASVKGRATRKRHRLTAKGKASQARYWRSPKGVAARKRSKIKSSYGLDAVAYRALWESQGGRCANSSCLVEIIMHTQTCCVDHCHDTDKVRGLLCVKCNLVLGVLEKQRKRIEGLHQYLCLRIQRDGVPA